MSLNTNLTSTSTISSTIKTYYDRKLLMNAKPYLVHQEYGQKVVIPKNSGKTVQFRKWTPFTPKIGALTEGVVPDGQSLLMTEVTADLNQYGGYVAVSDMLDLTAIDPVVNDTVELIADQGGISIDTVVKNAITTSTNVQFAGGKITRATLDANCKLTVEEIRKAVRSLKKNKAPQHIRNGKGYYVAIVGPDTTYDLQNDSIWQDVSKYSASEQIFDGEIGKLFGVIFVETTEARTFVGEGMGGMTVFSTMLLGRNAYGVIDLEGGNLRTIIKPRGSGGTADPLDQVSTIGWKVDGFACKVLQPLWMMRIEHTASV